MGDPALALAGLSLPRGTRRVAVAVPDQTRSMDTAGALAALKPHLEGLAVTVVVGLGLHRPMTDRELAPLRAAAGAFAVLNHDPDRCVATGEVDGLPGEVHPAIAEADLCLAVGVVELHQYAGFSGGHKAVAVGCGGRATLDALHTRERVCDERVRLGRLEGNPFRAAVDGLGRLARCTWAVQSVAGGWVGGPPEQALAAAARWLAPWVSVQEPMDRVILRVPASKASNFYQASRAATYLALSPAPPLHEGALLVLDAACPEGAGLGAGERAFAQLLASSRPPWQELLYGPTVPGAGTQRAWMLARLAARYRLVVAGCAQAEALQALGIEATARPAEEVAGPGAQVVEQPFVRLPQLEPAR